MFAYALFLSGRVKELVSKRADKSLGFNPSSDGSGHECSSAMGTLQREVKNRKLESLGDGRQQA